MTADLMMMLDLRDLQVAQDVAKRAEMGWFDVEFTMYGCCYLKGGQPYFRVSAEACAIYDYIEAASLQQVLPTNLLSRTKTCPVPLGMKEEIAYQVKRELAQELHAAYPAEFLHLLAQTAEEAADDSAYAILQRELEAIIGCFDHRRLRHFEELVNYAYSCRKLSGEHHQQLLHELACERRSMEDVPESQDIFQKTFYAIAYQTDTGLAIIDNAQKATIYAKKYALERQGHFVTPILSETYWYNYTLRLPDVHKRFLESLPNRLNDHYLTTLAQISRHNAHITASDFRARLAGVAQQYGPLACETYEQYGRRWGIL